MSNTSDAAKVQGHIREAQRRFKQDEITRKLAEKSSNSIILTKTELQGDWDASRVLLTTLGGKPRVITENDIATFRHNMNVARSRFKTDGITARQVIDLASSLPLKYVSEKEIKAGYKSDIDKAKKQIKTAVALSAKEGMVRFSTSSGGESLTTRHLVLIRFNAFNEAARQLAGKKISNKSAITKAANWLRKQPLAFDCTCERHRYFFRYIATIGGFAAGRQEWGYPKIRNPNLNGVACKHVLRVLAEVESSQYFGAFLSRHLAAVQSSKENKVSTRTKQKEATAAVEKQEKGRARAIKTTAERKEDARKAKERRAAKAAVKDAPRLNSKTPKATRNLQDALERGLINASDLNVWRQLFTDEEIATKLNLK